MSSPFFLFDQLLYSHGVFAAFMSSPLFFFDQLLYSHGVFAAFIALLAMETENPNAANIAMRKLAVR
jgi:hypothetical protein